MGLSLGAIRPECTCEVAARARAVGHSQTPHQSFAAIGERHDVSLDQQTELMEHLNADVP